MPRSAGPCQAWTQHALRILGIAVPLRSEATVFLSKQAADEYEQLEHELLQGPLIFSTHYISRVKQD